MNLTLKQLTAFCAVANTGGFSRASTLIGLPQSAISVLIKELERELAVRLFDRTTRRVELTGAGTEFLSTARKVLSDLEHAVEDSHALGERKRGRLTVAGPPLLVEALIPKVLAPFKRDFPGIKVIVLDARTERIVEAVKSGEADIGFGTFDHLDTSLATTRLARQDLSLFCAESHPFAERESMKWKAIGNSPLIVLERKSGIQHLVDATFHSVGIQPNEEYEVTFIATALVLVEIGVGVSVLPPSARSLVGSRPIKSVALTDPVATRDITMISRQGRSLSPAATEWVRRMKVEMNASYGQR